jgi:hypothetical protein
MTWSKLWSSCTVTDQSESAQSDGGAPQRKLSAIFNDPQYGGDRSYGLEWNAHPNAKVVVFALPKSGNVWLMALLSDYFGVPSINIFNDYDKKGVGMTHFPFSEEIRWRDDIIHGACLVRDIRDVISSFYHYSQSERFRSARKEFQYTDIDAFYYDWFLPIVVPQYRVHRNSAEYAELCVPVIRYERLYDDPVSELRKLVLRWGLQFDELRAKEVVSMNSIEKLKENGKTLDIYVDQSHFRKGGYGDYKQTLPQHIINDVSERFRELQRRWGYE